MLKFVKHHMASIENIELFPLLALILFMLVFLYFTIWAFSVRKTYISELEKMPLDNTISDHQNMKR